MSITATEFEALPSSDRVSIVVNTQTDCTGATQPRVATAAGVGESRVKDLSSIRGIRPHTRIPVRWLSGR